MEQRRARLSPEGRGLLAELQRYAEAFEPPSDEVLSRFKTLPPSERKEIAAIFGALALDVAGQQREEVQRATFTASAAEIIREAREREKAAGKPVDPDMMLGDALEILGR